MQERVAVIKRPGLGITPGYHEHGLQLFWHENIGKIEPTAIHSCLIPCLLVVFTQQLKILVTALLLSVFIDLLTCWHDLRLTQTKLWSLGSYLAFRKSSYSDRPEGFKHLLVPSPHPTLMSRPFISLPRAHHKVVGTQTSPLPVGVISATKSSTVTFSRPFCLITSAKEGQN